MATYRGATTPSAGQTVTTDADDVVNVPAGNITATDVQAAINELDTEKVAKAGDTMTGDLTVPNLITSGNVDGRDVSVDGTKLDGIEIGATADQTGAEIATLLSSETIATFTSTGIDDNATSTAITIDSSENIGIGVTPEAWKSDQTALQIGGLGAIMAKKDQAAASTAQFILNSYRDETDWKYIVTDEASRYLQSAGAHYFYVAPSGTADTAITWTTALTIDNSAKTTFGGDVSLGDSKSLNIGTGGDLTFTHGGTNSNIQNKTGRFYITERTTSEYLELGSYNSSDVYKTGIAVGGSTPYVRLYYDGVRTAQTLTTGLGAYASGDFASFNTYREDNHGSGVNIGAFYFIGKDSASNNQTYAYVMAHVVDDTSGSEDGRITFNTIQAGTVTNMAYFEKGIHMPGATGGDKGSGTINATAVYDDNTLLTDYVFDYHLDGEINPDDAVQAEKFLSDTSVLDLDSFSNHWKTNRHLPSLPSREQWESEGAHSVGKLAQRLWETVEVQAVHIDNLNQRLKQLEGV